MSNFPDKVNSHNFFFFSITKQIWLFSRNPSKDFFVIYSIRNQIEEWFVMAPTLRMHAW